MSIVRLVVLTVLTAPHLPFPPPASSSRSVIVARAAPANAFRTLRNVTKTAFHASRNLHLASATAVIPAHPARNRSSAAASVFPKEHHAFASAALVPR
ncbi:MAG: hypothetical protein IPM54_15510 [Polyangiaceae bacterium]|nr:hypothetical protein [Polyangiaceae bacterium]